MADYKGIKGFTIQTIAGDPPAPILGQVWYNTTSNVLKGYATVAGSWSSGGNLNTTRTGPVGAGSQTAALCISGNAGGPITAFTEQYNGSAWTEVGDLGTARYEATSAGTTTAGLLAGGNNNVTFGMGNVEEYNGTSWSEVNNIGTARYKINPSIGTQTAALAVGGILSSTQQDLNESYDGTSWTELADLNSARGNGGAAGTSTAAILAGGLLPGQTNFTETWDGTSWTEVGNLNTVRNSCGSAFQAASTAALIFGGDNGGPARYMAITEKWDGTSWTEVADLATACRTQAGAGTGSAALSAGGDNPPVTAQTEEWTEGPTVVTFTSS
jgi:hypothetical protein